MIIKLVPQDASHVAIIHACTLKGDFLPSLGLDFLTTLYSGVLGKGGVFAFGYRVKGKAVGFVVGSVSTNHFFLEALKAKIFLLIYYLLIEVFRQPQILKNIFETVFYSSRDKGPDAELVVIAVDNRWQGQGIGRKLTEALEKTFSKKGIGEYKLTVHADKKAVQFYEHLKYKKISTFNLYGKLWYVFSKKIKSSWSGRKKN